MSGDGDSSNFLLWYAARGTRRAVEALWPSREPVHLRGQVLSKRERRFEALWPLREPAAQPGPEQAGATARVWPGPPARRARGRGRRAA